MSRHLVLIVLVSLLASAFCSSSNLVVVSRQDNGLDEGQSPRQNRINSRDTNQGQSSGQFDPTDILMELALATPVGVAANYVAPTAVKGLQTDLSKNYGMMANGVQSGFGSLQTGASSIGDSTFKRLQQMQQNLYNRLNQATFVRAYEALTEPQTYCSNFAKAQQFLNEAGQQLTEQSAQQLEALGQSADRNLQQSGSLASQAGKQSSILLNKLSPFGGFGK